MAGFKILVLFVAFQIVNSRSLLKEVHMKKNFEFSFTPLLLPIKPFTFFKQKVLNFGHGIVKRSPFEVAPRPEGNVENRDSLFEATLDREFGAGSPVPPLPPPPPLPLPEPVMFTPEQPASSPAPPPVTSPVVLVREDILSRLPLDGPEVIVITPVPPPPPIVSVPEVVPPPPPAPAPIPGPPPPVPPEPPKLVQGNLLTDIARVDEINEYLKAVEALGIPPPAGPLVPPPEGPPPPPPIEAVLPVLSSNSIEVEVPKPPPPPPVEKTSPLVKGSRLALYFGNILLQVMSGVISSARSALSQYSSPAPI